MFARKFLFLLFLFASYADAGLSIFINPVGYGGAVIDRESGLQYLNARYLKNDLNVAVFLSQDTFSDQKKGLFDNRYNYTAGDPVNHEDPRGHMPEIVRSAGSFLSGNVGLASSLIISGALIAANIFAVTAATNAISFTERVTDFRTMQSAITARIQALSNADHDALALRNTIDGHVGYLMEQLPDLPQPHSRSYYSAAMTELQSIFDAINNPNPGNILQVKERFLANLRGVEARLGRDSFFANLPSNLKRNILPSVNILTGTVGAGLAVGSVLNPNLSTPAIVTTAATLTMAATYP